jgi:hypothetical protein
MLGCTIYATRGELDKKYNSGTIQNHCDMNTWLQTNGKKENSYEVHKGGSVHSIWILKEKTERWGRTATPSTKKMVINKEEDYKPPPRDRESRQKARQNKAKFNKSGR